MTKKRSRSAEGGGGTIVVLPTLRALTRNQSLGQRPRDRSNQSEQHRHGQGEEIADKEKRERRGQSRTAMETEKQRDRVDELDEEEEEEVSGLSSEVRHEVQAVEENGKQDRTDGEGNMNTQEGLGLTSS